MRRLGLSRGAGPARRRRGGRSRRPVDGGADAGRVAFGQQPVERVRDKGRVAEIARCGRRSRGASPATIRCTERAERQAHPLQIVAVENVQDLADRRPARARRRRRDGSDSRDRSRRAAAPRSPCNRQNRFAVRMPPSARLARVDRSGDRPSVKRIRALLWRSPRASRRGPFAPAGRRACRRPPSGRRNILRRRRVCGEIVGLGVEQRGVVAAQHKAVARQARSPAPSPPRAAGVPYSRARRSSPITVPGTPTAR